MQFLMAIFHNFFRQQPDAFEIADLVSAPISVIQIDKHIQSIKAIAALRMSYRPFSDDAYAGLSERTKDWLQTLTTEMLLKVISASYSNLREHLASRKTIRGLLAADPASVAAYKEAVRPKMSLSDIEGRRGGGGPKRSAGGPKF